MVLFALVLVTLLSLTFNNLAFKLLLVVLQSRSIGQETITLLVLFDLLGHRLLSLTITLHSILMFNKSTVTKLEDADHLLLIPMEVTVVLLMDLLILAQSPLLFLWI